MCMHQAQQVNPGPDLSRLTTLGTSDGPPKDRSWSSELIKRADAGLKNITWNGVLMLDLPFGFSRILLVFPHWSPHSPSYPPAWWGWGKWTAHSSLVKMQLLRGEIFILSLLSIPYLCPLYASEVSRVQIPYRQQYLAFTYPVRTEPGTRQKIRSFITIVTIPELPKKHAYISRSRLLLTAYLAMERQVAERWKTR